ncbi:hypothetical protein CYMTET_26449 [Cymbomonas tetramitiformis]|uniref:alkaline phosphatase n=1 Tax=Cymbomonas tetramitiformis TaxID=36881 RepID=A0AAE0KXX7_9CHLO|nr:hypothetical protein CYMTET_26449 [Cymbomonas tetramitiformis]
MSDTELDSLLGDESGSPKVNQSTPFSSPAAHWMRWMYTPTDKLSQKLDRYQKALTHPGVLHTILKNKILQQVKDMQVVLQAKKDGISEAAYDEKIQTWRHEPTETLRKELQKLEATLQDRADTDKVESLLNMLVLSEIIKKKASKTSKELPRQRKTRKWGIVGVMSGVAKFLVLAAIVIALGALGFHALEQKRQAPPLDQAAPKNVVLLVADGMGPGYLTLAREALGLPGISRSLSLDRHVKGVVRSRSLDSAVTDCAASATALATGCTTKNGWLGMRPWYARNGGTLESIPWDEEEPEWENALSWKEMAQRETLHSLLEHAESQDKWTGMVSTARVTDETLAAFFTHESEGISENEVAEAQLNLGLEVLLGGGHRHFVSKDKGGERGDGRDLLRHARVKGYQVVETSAELERAHTTPLLGLFNASHLSYAIDRRGMSSTIWERPRSESAPATEEPTLAEMVRKAVQVLKGAPEGFVLVVEAGRVEHAGRSHDAAAALAEVLEFDEAFEAVLALTAAAGDTLVVATSDHDCGGLTVGCSESKALNAARVISMRASIAHMSMEVSRDELSAAEMMRRIGWVHEEEQVRNLQTHHAALVQDEGSEEAQRGLGRALSEAQGVGFTSSGRTASDVLLHASGPGAEAFSGGLHISRVGEILRGFVVTPAQEPPVQETPVQE